VPRKSKTSGSRFLVMQFLREEVGLGNTFTMTQLRERYPGIAQIDRRMRDLRPAGWIIESNQTDPTLPLNTYRLSAIGGEDIPRTFSGRVRREIFDASENRCQVCGVGVGEPYPDDVSRICRLQVGHWVPQAQGGSVTDRGNLRAECQRCNEAIRNRQGAVVTAQAVLVRATSLRRSARTELITWMRQGNRSQSDEERIWYEWKQLPPVERQNVLNELVRRSGES
jgi:hypothetical protein